MGCGRGRDWDWDWDGDGVGMRTGMGAELSSANYETTGGRRLFATPLECGPCTVCMPDKETRCHLSADPVLFVLLVLFGLFA